MLCVFLLYGVAFLSEIVPDPPGERAEAVCLFRVCLAVESEVATLCSYFDGQACQIICGAQKASKRQALIVSSSAPYEVLHIFSASACFDFEFFCIARRPFLATPCSRPQGLHSPTPFILLTEGSSDLNCTALEDSPHTSQATLVLN